MLRARAPCRLLCLPWWSTTRGRHSDDWARTGAEGGVLPYLSLLNHTEPFLKGVFDTRDVVYHLLFIATFLALSVRRLDMDRLGG